MQLIPDAEAGKIHIRKEHTKLKSQFVKFHGEADQKGLNLIDALAYIKDVGVTPKKEEETGIGSPKNQELWKKMMKGIRDERDRGTLPMHVGDAIDDMKDAYY